MNCLCTVCGLLKRSPAGVFVHSLACDGALIFFDDEIATLRLVSSSAEGSR